MLLLPSTISQTVGVTGDAFPMPRAQVVEPSAGTVPIGVTPEPPAVPIKPEPDGLAPGAPAIPELSAILELLPGVLRTGVPALLPESALQAASPKSTPNADTRQADTGHDPMARSRARCESLNDFCDILSLKMRSKHGFPVVGFL
jgi:hypothetical protein